MICEKAGPMPGDWQLLACYFHFQAETFAAARSFPLCSELRRDELARRARMEVRFSQNYSDLVRWLVKNSGQNPLTLIHLDLPWSVLNLNELGEGDFEERLRLRERGRLRLGGTRTLAGVFKRACVRSQ